MTQICVKQGPRSPAHDSHPSLPLLPRLGDEAAVLVTAGACWARLGGLRAPCTCYQPMLPARRRPCGRRLSWAPRHAESLAAAPCTPCTSGVSVPESGDEGLQGSGHPDPLPRRSPRCRACLLGRTPQPPNSRRPVRAVWEPHGSTSGSRSPGCPPHPTPPMAPLCRAQADPPPQPLSPTPASAPRLSTQCHRRRGLS